MPACETDTMTLVDGVTPHAFRAGLAGDLAAEGAPWQSIAVQCRWNSMRAMRMYAGRPSLQAQRRSRLFCVLASRR